MSLRWFHLFFISLAVLLFLGLAAICFHSYKNNVNETVYLVSGIVGAVLGLALLIYGILFGIKMRRLKS